MIDWMPYQLGDSLMRLPSLEESAMTLEELAKRGKVYRTGKWSHYTAGKIADYRRGETSENVITHCQQRAGSINYFLKTYGLESWMITVKL